MDGNVTPINYDWTIINSYGWHFIAIALLSTRYILRFKYWSSHLLFTILFVGRTFIFKSTTISNTAKQEARDDYGALIRIFFLSFSLRKSSNV
tara:strand:+ start:205 stop:483 length:279 start_codon:yes stop_codon:yes gene_type:complete